MVSKSLVVLKGFESELDLLLKINGLNIAVCSKEQKCPPPLSEEEVFDLPSLPHVGCFSGRWGKAEYVTGSFKVGLEFVLRSFEDKTVLFTRARNRYTLDSCYF